jgi:hypothetical protein
LIQSLIPNPPDWQSALEAIISNGGAPPGPGCSQPSDAISAALDAFWMTQTHFSLDGASGAAQPALQRFLGLVDLGFPLFRRLRAAQPTIQRFLG